MKCLVSLSLPVCRVSLPVCRRVQHTAQPPRSAGLPPKRLTGLGGMGDFAATAYTHTREAYRAVQRRDLTARRPQPARPGSGGAKVSADVRQASLASWSRVEVISTRRKDGHGHRSSGPVPATERVRVPFRPLVSGSIVVVSAFHSGAATKIRALTAQALGATVHNFERTRLRPPMVAVEPAGGKSPALLQSYPGRAALCPSTFWLQSEAARRGRAAALAQASRTPARASGASLATPCTSPRPRGSQGRKGFNHDAA
jgi:hypothetical protein